jgi:selenide,water dikinase
LCGFDPPTNDRLLRGLADSEDAGVYQLSASQALVQTVDILTPMVDDPWLFGRIAAANALSDVYAMGGRPLTALNVLCFPLQALGVEMMRELLQGGLDAISEAGAVLVGGHSIKDEEPKYGLSVTGLVDPRRLMTNDALRPAQQLLLTKPIGTGVIASTHKKGLCSGEALTAAVGSMCRLNRRAAELAVEADLRAASDVTGFGLAGHLVEMARASTMDVRLWADAVPLLPEALAHAEADRLPGGSRANREFFSRWVESEPALAAHLVDLMFDAQTSGGLLLAAPAEVAGALVEQLQAEEHQAAVIGEVVAPHEQGRLAIV